MNRQALEEEKARLEAMIGSNNFAGYDGAILYSPASAISLLARINAMLSGEDPPSAPSGSEESLSVATMPANLAALALPDESLADLKTRLLTELTTLRSMAVGQIPMTDEQRAMLTTLEGQVAQQWFRS